MCVCVYTHIYTCELSIRHDTPENFPGPRLISLLLDTNYHRRNRRNAVYGVLLPECLVRISLESIYLGRRIRYFPSAFLASASNSASAAPPPAASSVASSHWSASSLRGSARHASAALYAAFFVGLSR